MKTLAARQNMDESSYVGDGGDLPDLVNRLQVHRDNDNESTGGSALNSQGGVSRGNLPSQSAEKSKGGSTDYSGSQHLFGISSPFGGGLTSNVDQLFNVAKHVEDLYQIPEGEEDESYSDLGKENATFLSQIAASHPDVPPAYLDDKEEELPKGENGGVDEQTPMLPQTHKRLRTLRPSGGMNKMLASITAPSPESRFYRFSLWWSELRKQMKILVAAFDASHVKEKLWLFIQNHVTLFVVPSLAISFFFFYELHNPIDQIFFKMDASISWLILFALRHYLTLQVSE
jgi:hypothetical protein